MTFRMLIAKQGGADPHKRRSFFGRHAVVLGGAHRELAQAMLLRKVAQTAEIRARGLRIVRERRHRREAADLAPECEVTIELGRLDARLRRLAGEVDLDESADLELLGGGLGVERVDELADA